MWQIIITGADLAASNKQVIQGYGNLPKEKIVLGTSSWSFYSSIPLGYTITSTSIKSNIYNDAENFFSSKNNTVSIASNVPTTYGNGKPLLGLPQIDKKDKNYETIMKELNNINNQYQESFGGTNPLDFINKSVDSNSVNWLAILEGFNDASAAAITFGLTTWFDVGPKVNDEDLADYYLGQFLGYNAVGIASAYAAAASTGVALGGGTLALAGGPPGAVVGGSTAVAAGATALVQSGISVYAFSKTDKALENYNTYDKQRKGTLGNNQAQNKQIDDIVKKHNLTKDQRRQLHDEISGQNMNYHDIDKIAKEIKAGR